MDKGAARSKKREQQLERAALRAAEEKRLKAKTGPSSEAGPSKPRPAKPLPQKKQRPRPEDQSRDPALYTAKAVRSNAALNWASGPFQLPPPSLEGITRVDLTGSGVTDVSWLAGSGVRWLGLSGCVIKDWSAVGSLEQLTVLNINECQLTDLPTDLKGLKNLKALVAMNNPWKTISADVLSSWPELNSLIISHSPNLTAIPNLSTSIHLSKLTFSHCPRLTVNSISNFSSLPLLRDVKMNNLPLLTALPAHIPYWGTGPMSSLSATDTRKGQGLEVLDVGSCSLTDTAVALLKKAQMTNLRSLTLHHNPLSRSAPNYAEDLQGQSGLPKLAIIDNKRVVERVKRPEGEKKKNGKGNKGKASGANVDGNAKMRTWGSKAEGEVGEEEAAAPVEKVEKKEKKRKREEDGAAADKGTTMGNKAPKISKEDKSARGDTGKPEKRVKSDAKAGKPMTVQAPTSAIVSASAPNNPAADAVKTADPSALTANSKKHSRNETGVYGVVEVVKPKEEKSKNKVKKEKRKGAKEEGAVEGSKSEGGIDLKEMFGKNDDGLGVGGW